MANDGVGAYGVCATSALSITTVLASRIKDTRCLPLSEMVATSCSRLCVEYTVQPRDTLRASTKLHCPGKSAVSPANVVRYREASRVHVMGCWGAAQRGWVAAMVSTPAARQRVSYSATAASHQMEDDEDSAASRAEQMAAWHSSINGSGSTTVLQRSNSLPRPIACSHRRSATLPSVALNVQGCGGGTSSMVHVGSGSTNRLASSVSIIQLLACSHRLAAALPSLVIRPLAGSVPSPISPHRPHRRLANLLRGTVVRTRPVDGFHTALTPLGMVTVTAPASAPLTSCPSTTTPSDMRTGSADTSWPFTSTTRRVSSMTVLSPYCRATTRLHDDRSHVTFRTWTENSGMGAQSAAST